MTPDDAGTPKPVLVVAPDLFFAARIAETARTLGVPVTACAPAELPAIARALHPSRAIVDLHAPGAIDAVRALRAEAATREVRVIGFYSHVDTAIRDAARAAGVTETLPRSAFTARLAELLGG